MHESRMDMQKHAENEEKTPTTTGIQNANYLMETHTDRAREPTSKSRASHQPKHRPAPDSKRGPRTLFLLHGPPRPIQKVTPHAASSTHINWNRCQSPEKHARTKTERASPSCAQRSLHHSPRRQRRKAWRQKRTQLPRAIASIRCRVNAPAQQFLICPTTQLQPRGCIDMLAQLQH
jgi:hypothetical protein